MGAIRYHLHIDLFLNTVLGWLHHRLVGSRLLLLPTSRPRLPSPRPGPPDRVKEVQAPLFWTLSTIFCTLALLSSSLEDWLEQSLEDEDSLSPAGMTRLGCLTTGLSSSSLSTDPEQVDVSPAGSFSFFGHMGGGRRVVPQVIEVLEQLCLGRRLHHPPCPPWAAWRGPSPC